MGKRAGVKTGRHHDKRVLWSDEDLEFLKLSFPELRNDEMGIVFPEKPLRTILTKASDLGIKKRVVGVLTGLVAAVPEQRTPQEWHKLRLWMAIEAHVKRREAERRVLQEQIDSINSDIAAHLALLD